MGSHARGEAGEGSDLDLKLRVSPATLVKFFSMPPEAHAETYLSLILDLEALLGCPVDLLGQSEGLPWGGNSGDLRGGLLRDRREVYDA